METNRRSPFGIALRRFREASGLSQEQLAERAGLSLRGISDLERGLRTTPRLETVNMLARGLRLDAAQRVSLFAARNTHHTANTSQHQHRRSRLPTPPTSFIGRELEIQSITDQFDSRESRLLTLVGPGGIGKTRIAIEAAHQIARWYAGEVVFIDLSAVRYPELVIPAIAEGLGLAEQRGTEIKDVLAVALADRSMLLVLDNLEQVIEAAQDISWLLAACPDLTILATSRAPLRVNAERMIAIEPMTLPSPDDVSSLPKSDAVTLFVSRARAVDHFFALTPENASAVTDVVTRLQGMPLAIELAAARIRLLSIPDLLSRLDSQLPLLTGGARDAPERHRTMRNTILWSYELLSQAEQAVFRTLSIFPDGCTLETAIAVLGVESRFTEVEALDVIESLVDASILRPQEGSDGQTRYRMLQTLQEFGLEMLAATGEEIMVRQASHDAWCKPLARQSEFLRSRPDAHLWLPLMDAESQNMRSHVTWLITRDRTEEALDISGSLAAFREIRGYLEEGRAELEMLLAHPQNQADSLIRMRGLVGLGVMSALQGKQDQSVSALTEGIELAQAVGERWYLSRAMQALALAKSQVGQLDEAESLTRGGLAIAQELGDGFLISGATGNLGLVYALRGDLERAYQLIAESLELSLAFGNPWRVALSKLNLGSLSLRHGWLDEAETLLQESGRLFIELNDPRDLPAVYLYLADIARLREDLSTAERMLEHAQRIASDVGNMSDIGHSCAGLAQISRLRGDLATSRKWMCRAIHWFERSGSVFGAVSCLNHCAEIALFMGEGSRAAWCLGAVEGVTVDRGMSRPELLPGEDKARMGAAMAMLSESEWELHHALGRSLPANEILPELNSWLSCRTSAETRVAPSVQSAQSDYDNRTWSKPAQQDLC